MKPSTHIFMSFKNIAMPIKSVTQKFYALGVICRWSKIKSAFVFTIAKEK